MNRHERGLEFKVGAFVFVGLAMLGALVVQFGRLGEGLRTYYPLTVRFNDASGLLKGSDVLLAGAKESRYSLFREHGKSEILHGTFERGYGCACRVFKEIGWRHRQSGFNNGVCEKISR